MENYKMCPYCGQDQIPFKLGVCVCGCQVGKTRYVEDSQKFAANYYIFLGIKNNPLAAGYVPSE